MAAKRHQMFFVPLVFLLVLATLAASGAPAASSQAQALSTARPDGLRSAFLAASSQAINSLIYLEQHVAASDGAAGDNFGASVALSGDGLTALVGASADDVVGTDQGSAYVFTLSGTTWGEQAQLTASDANKFDRFGASVALSGDGLTALVGAPGDNDGQGSAYVFMYDGVWKEMARLVASDGAASDDFGFSVALSADGHTALVGADLDDVGENSDQGSAYVFTGSWTTWSQQAQLTAADGAASDHFGDSVALAGDTALVGASHDHVGAIYSGSAYVFTRSGTTWSQQAQLTALESTGGDFFGTSVALAGDGHTALVGANGAYELIGAAYVFTLGAISWSQQQAFFPWDNNAPDYFGTSVALSVDGHTALVGMPQDDAGANGDEGSAYVFTRGGTGWSERGKVIASDGAAGDGFGASVALAGDTALVGANYDSVGANSYQGSAYFFKLMFAVYLPSVLKNVP